MKPIFLTEDEKAALKKEVEKAIDQGYLVDGSFSFSRKFIHANEEKTTISLFYSPGAYLKMKMLIDKFSSEVAWHGLIRRLGPTEFLIYDILVFKQNVTGSTVTTDDESYVKFLMDLKEDEANAMRMHGHSHVNMGVTPSATDTTYQKDVVSNLNGKGFYLFQIWNKSLKSTSILYDFENGVMYEDKDIVIDIMDDNGFSMSDFIVDSEKLVINRTAIKSYSKPDAAAPKKTKTKSAESRLQQDAEDEFDDYTDPLTGTQYYRNGFVYNGKYYAYD